MPITPYALNVKGVDVSQPINMLSAVRQLQAQGQQQQMNALAMQKAQQEMAESDAFRNALNKYDYMTPEGMANIVKESPTLGLGLQKTVSSLTANQTQADLNRQKLFDAKNKAYMGLAANIQTPDQAKNFLQGMYADPVVGPSLQALQPLDHVLEHIPSDPEGFKRFVGVLSNGPAWMLQEAKGAQQASLKQREIDAANQRAQAQINAAAQRNQATIDAAAAKGIVVGPGSSLVQNGKVIYTAPKTDKASWETTTDMDGNVTAFNPATGETKSFGKIGQSKGSWVQSTDDKGNLTIVNPQTGEQKTFTGIGKTNVAPDQLQLARDKFNQQKSQDEFNRNMAERKQQFEEWKASPETQMVVAESENYGKEMAKNNVLYQQKMPDVIQQAQLGSSLIDKMIGERKFDEKGNVTGYGKPHPGFENAVGLGIGLRFVPGSPASDFQAYFDQLKGQAFLQAFQTLKGGGSITVEEGKKATDAINRMSLAQSEKEFVAAAREFQSILESGARKAQMKLEETGIPKGRGFTYNPKGGEQARPSLEDIFNQ